jgi:hypothetical protein
MSTKYHEKKGGKDVTAEQNDGTVAIYLRTAEGTQRVDPGGWTVTNADGSQCALTDEDFKAQYSGGDKAKAKSKDDDEKPKAVKAEESKPWTSSSPVQPETTSRVWTDEGKTAR